MQSRSPRINNGIVERIHFISPEDREFSTFKTMFTLSPEMNTPENHAAIIKKLINDVGTTVNNQLTQIKLNYIPFKEGYRYQIETNLEPQQLLGSMWSTGLINQEEMTRAYKDSGNIPTNLSNNHQQISKQRSRFSLF